MYYQYGLDLHGHDLFETNKFYFSWIDSLSFVKLDTDIIAKLISVTAYKISSFEPLSAFFVFLLSKILSGENLIHILNVSFILLIFNLVSKNNKFWLLILILLTIEILFGFYTSILLFQTHRLKLAIIAFYFLLKYRSNLLLLIVVPTLFHFSILVISPLIYLFVEKASNLRKSFPYLLLFGFIFSSIYFIAMDNFFIEQVILNKLDYFIMDSLKLYILLALTILFVFIRKRKINLSLDKHYVILMYFIFLLIFFDLSRILMLFYVCVLGFFVKNIFEKKVFNIFFLTIFIWSLYRGLDFSLI